MKDWNDGREVERGRESGRMPKKEKGKHTHTHTQRKNE